MRPSASGLVATVVAVASLWIAGAPAAADTGASAALTPAEALATLRASPFLAAEEVDAVRRALAPAISSGGDDPRWSLARALLATHDGADDASLAAARRAVEALPDEADAHYALGVNLFMLVGEVSWINRGARAEKARRSMERALELDPAHLGARIGVIEYRLRAPGIAGGSKKKARALAEEALEHDATAYYGHLTLGELAAGKKDWDEMTSRFERAAALAPDAPRRAQVLLRHAQVELRDREDAEAALPLARAALESGAGYLAEFYSARCLRELGRCDEAIPHYRAVLDAHPEAQNTNYELAVCLEESGAATEAADQYRRYLDLHPDGEHARAARRALKGLKPSGR